MSLVLALILAAPATDVGAELERLTERRLQANAANDRAFYERLLADEFVLILASRDRPPQGRREYLEAEFGGRPASYRGPQATMSGFRAVVSGDTAVATYRLVEPTVVGDQRFDLHTSRVDAYARRQGAWRLVSMAVADPPTWPDVAAVDPALYDEYAGTYEAAPGARVVVTHEGGRLLMEVTGQDQVELFPESSTSFFDRTDSPLARNLFERDASGAVVAQVYAAQGQRVRARRAGAPAPSVVEGHVAGTDGVRLFFRRVGSGSQAVVFLHGGPGANFRGQGDIMERLASRDRTVVLYDQRGSGLSDLVSDPKLLTAEHHLRDLEALRAHFKFERMSIIGLSWGSGLAALYAAAHPDRVDRLLLVGPMSPTIAQFRERLAVLGRLQPAAALEARKAMVDRIRTADDAETPSLCRELSDVSFRVYVVDPTPAKLAHAALRCGIPAAAIRNRYVVETATLGSLGDWDFRPLLARIRAPALVIEGAKTNVPLEATREWATTLPNARLVLIPDAGHESFLDQPDAFVTAADEFLRGR